MSTFGGPQQVTGNWNPSIPIERPGGIIPPGLLRAWRVSQSAVYLGLYADSLPDGEGRAPGDSPCLLKVLILPGDRNIFESAEISLADSPYRPQPAVRAKDGGIIQ